MEFRVNRRTLLLIAGCVWIIAGINILRIGIITWLNDAHYWLFKVGEAIVVFLLFFQFVFRRLFVKHSERISQKGEKNCPFSFFDVKGWIVMIFMITFGVTIRHFQLLPNSFISVFYTLYSNCRRTFFKALRQCIIFSFSQLSTPPSFLPQLKKIRRTFWKTHRCLPLPWHSTQLPFRNLQHRPFRRPFYCI